MNYLLTPLAIMGIFTLVSYVIYRIGGKLAPKVPQSDDKLMAYASGENIAGMKATQSYSLFHVAFIFTIFHVAVILLAMIPNSPDAIYALAFLGGLVISAFALVTGGEPDD
ncbi:MAG: hypothetical protein Q7J68_02580 [Thermoplasmata archaeon]|nr:hypothetical protein [Thermoplasmata archaeon]